MNQPEQDESLSASGEKEYEFEDEWIEDEDAMHDDNFSDQQYIEGLVVVMVFGSDESLFTFYEEHSRLTDFGVVKKSSHKKSGEYARYLSFACAKSRKSTPRNSSKRVDCKAKINSFAMPDVATSLEAHDIARIRPSKSIRLLEVDDGGPHRVGYTLKDYILQQRKMRTLSSDAATIQKFFSDTQTKDDEFFYLINPNNSARLRNVV
ncbi:hypothetical protein H5410_041680 [Solanum commersonii]|uniref:Protein FAR1-RELATED SEQUENCE n=1 Tax=Solanum commersonii TaxID=4109 RepID=A0A9J5XW83_SOLCO|nr:hypothetical protein H5410_041680 [Solanum commersonii]